MAGDPFCATHSGEPAQGQSSGDPPLGVQGARSNEHIGARVSTYTCMHLHLFATSSSRLSSGAMALTGIVRRSLPS